MKTLKDLVKESIDWYINSNQDFSAHDVTERVRRVVNSTTDLLDLPRLTINSKTFWNVDHEEVKKLVNGTFLAGELKRAFNGQYFVYESIKGRIQPLLNNAWNAFTGSTIGRSLSGILPAAQVSASPAVATQIITVPAPYRKALTTADIEGYIKRNGPRTIEQIRARFSKTRDKVRCADIAKHIWSSQILDTSSQGQQAVSKFAVYKL